MRSYLGALLNREGLGKLLLALLNAAAPVELLHMRLCSEDTARKELRSRRLTQQELRDARNSVRFQAGQRRDVAVANAISLIDKALAESAAEAQRVDAAEDQSIRPLVAHDFLGELREEEFRMDESTASSSRARRDSRQPGCFGLDELGVLEGADSDSAEGIAPPVVAAVAESSGDLPRFDFGLLAT